MSLKDFNSVLQTPEWGELSLDDQVLVLTGAFAGEIESQKDEDLKKGLYNDFRESRKIVASNKVRERLGDALPLQVKAYSEFLETDEMLRAPKKDAGMQASGTLPPIDPATGIRHLESVELLAGQDFGSEKLRKQLTELGPDSFGRDDFAKAFIQPGFQEARQRAMEENRDLGAVIRFSQPEPTEFKDWGKTGVQIRKKPVPGSAWQVKFPDGTIEDLKAQKEVTSLRPPSDVEKVAGGAASLVTDFARFSADGAIGRAAWKAVAPVEEQTYEPYGSLETSDIAPRQLIEFVGKRSSKLGDDLRKEFQEQYGSYDVGSVRDVLVSGPIRGVMQSVEGVGGTVQQIQRAGAIATGSDPGADTMASQFARGASETAKSMRNNLAPKKADAGAIGGSFATITEAGTGLIVDMLAARGSGRIASVGFGAAAPMAAQIGKAGFAASSSTKILGSTYNDAFNAHRMQNKSIREAHDLASKEAQSIALVTAVLERAGPAEVFANPAAVRAGQTLVRRALVGGTAEGLGEEAPQAVAQVVLQQAFRNDGAADKEVENFRKAFGGDWEAFKNSQIIQGAIGGFGAGAGVAAIMGKGKTDAPKTDLTGEKTRAQVEALDKLLYPEAAPDTANLNNEELESAANKALVDEASKSTGQKIREQLAGVGSVVPEVPAVEVATEPTPVYSTPNGEVRRDDGSWVDKVGNPLAEEKVAPLEAEFQATPVDPNLPAAEMPKTSDTEAAVTPTVEAATPATAEVPAVSQTDTAAAKQADTQDQVVATGAAPEAVQAVVKADEELPDFVALAVTKAQEEADAAVALYKEEAANVARDSQMADEFGDQAAVAEEQAKIQDKIDAARAEAEAPPTINRVLEINATYTAPPTDPHLPATDETTAYRTVTEEDIKALRKDGRLASKAARTGEGANSVAWARGGSNVGFPTAANKGKYVVTTSAENLNGRAKAVSKVDILQVWQSDGTNWVDVTAEVKKPTDRVATREEWSRKVVKREKAQGAKLVDQKQRVVRAFLQTKIGQYFAAGKMLSLKAATERGLVGDARPAARWNGAKDLTKNPKINSQIYADNDFASTPDQVASAMFDDGLLPSSDMDTFWAELRKAINDAEAQVEAEFEGDVKEELLYELLDLISKEDSEADVEVDPYSLATGDNLIIGGRQFTVTSATGSQVVLQGDGKFEQGVEVAKATLEGAFVGDVRRGNPASAAPEAPSVSPEEKTAAQTNAERVAAAKRRNEEAFQAKRKAEQEAKQKAKAPESDMDRKAAESRELFPDDGGFKLAQQTTQDGDVEAKRKADAEAATEAADKAQQKMDLETEPEPEAPALTETDTRTPEQKLKDALKLAKQVADVVTKGAPTVTRDAVLDALIDQVTKDPDSPAALLYTIAQRAASTRGVTRKGERKAIAGGKVGTLDTGTPVADPALQPDEEVEVDERRQRLNDMMQLLSPQEREVLTREFRGESNRTIADALGLAVETVATTKSQAKKKLKKAAKRVGPVVSTRAYAPSKPFNPSLGSDQELIDKMTDRYTTKFGGVRPNLRAVTANLTRSQKKAAEMAAFFGRRAVFIKGLQTNGLFDPETPSVVYIADDAERPAAAVMYHELLHSLRATDPKAYQRLKDAVKVDLDAYIAQYPQRGEATEDRVREEFLADFLSDRATDPDFWVGLAQKDKTLFEKLIELLQSIVKSVRSGNLGTEKFIAEGDLEAANAAVLEALLTLQMQGSTMVEGKKGDLKTDRRAMTAEDKAYLAAVEAGDMETAQRIVDEAAKAAGYDSPRVYRNETVKGIEVYSMSKKRRSGSEKGVVFWTTNPEVAKDYDGVEFRSAYLNYEDPLVMDAGGSVKEKSWGEWLGWAKEDKNDALIVRNVIDTVDRLGGNRNAGNEMKSTVIGVFSPSQIKSADPIVKDDNGDIIPPSQRFNPESNDIRFDRRGEAGTPVQTGGRPNRFFNRPPSNRKVMEDLVRLTFDPDTASLDPKGVMQAVQFLGKLLDPAYVKSLTELAVRSGVPPLEAAIIPGVGRSAVLEFSNRLASSDPAAADTLRRKVEMSHRDLRFMFSGAVDASIIGKALSSLKSFAGGTIQRMFYLDREGRSEFVKKNYGQDGIDAGEASRNAELDAAGAEELADKIAADLDPETKERVAKAEAEARAAWVRVYGLVKRFFAPKSSLKTDRREGDVPDPEMTPEDAFRQFEDLVLSPDASLEDISAAFDAFIPLVEAELEAAERDSITRAKRKTFESTKTTEEATGTTNTRNQVDILAKRRIGTITRAKKQNDAEQAKRRQAFQDLINNKELGYNEFVAEYIRLGGTFEVGDELYSVNVKMLRDGKSEAEKQADAKVRKADSNVNELVESLVTKTLTPKGDGQRPTADNMTPERVMRQYRNPDYAGTPETLAAQLRQFADEKGDRLFNEDQIDTLVTAAGIARRLRSDARAARVKANAEAKIAERTELEKAEVERLAQVAEERAEREAEKLADLVDALVGDLLYPKKPGTRQTQENDTIRRAVSRFSNLDSGGSTTLLAADLRAFKNPNGTQKLGEDQIETLVLAAEVSRETALKARRAEQNARLDEQAKAAAVRSREKADREAKALQENVDNLVADLISPTQSGTRPTADNDTPRKLIKRAINLNSARIPNDVLAQLLRDFKNKDGSQRLTEEQIATLVIAAEIARNTRAEAESVKAEERDRKARSKQRDAEVKKAANIFSPRTRQARDPDKRSLRDIILQDFVNNPARKIMTQAERIEFAKEILREKTDLSEADIARVAVQMEGQLATTIEALKLKAVTPFLKSLGKKALSREQLAQAIRLEVLDPSKDFISAIASLAGWDGLTDAEYRRLVELQAKIDKAGADSRVATVWIAEQERIVHLATGIPPAIKDRINTYVRGNMFSGIISLTIGPLVGTVETGVSILLESAVAIGRNHVKNYGLDALSEMGAILRAYWVNSGRGLREAAAVATTGTTFIEQVQLEQAKADNTGSGTIKVDPATRAYDDAMNKMDKAIKDYQNNRTLNASKILWQAIRGYILAAGRFTFRALFMPDAAVTKTNAGAIAEIFKYREIKRLGITKERVRELQAEVERLVDSQRMFLQTELGLSGNLLEIEIRDRIEGAMLQALTLEGAEGLDTILLEGAADIQDRIGTGQTSQVTVAGRMTESFSTFVNNYVWPIAGVLPAIRTNGNIIDASMWYMPVVGLYRAIKYNKATTAERQAVFPNIRGDYQFRRKQMLAAFTNGSALAIFAMLMANKDLPEEEKWFRFTGAYPIGDKDMQNMWTAKGLSEYTLYIGNMPGINMKRGFGQQFMPALVTASMLVESFNGVDGKEGLRNVVALAELYMPGFSQAKGRFKATDGTYQASQFVENQLTMLVPLSGALQSVRRLGEPVDRRNTDASLLESNPFWVTSDEGVMRMRNILGEPLESETSPYTWMTKIGIPLQFRPVKEGRDPVKRQIMEDFYQNKFSGGKVTLADFRKKYGEEASVGQYKSFLQARTDFFISRYVPRRELLISRPDDYGTRVSELWENAGNFVARDLGLQKVSRTKSTESKE